jgi:hypothetical protein
MLSTKLKEAAGNSADATLYVNDVFSTYLYTGNGAAQTITNGIDLAGKGGLVFKKSRNNSGAPTWNDSARGLSNGFLRSDTTSAASGSSNIITAFNSNGFDVGGSGSNVGDTYVSWTFRKAAKFFDVVTWTGTGSARTIAHSLGVAPGMIIVKRTDTTGNWQVYSNGLTSAAYSMQLNLTAAQASAPTVWNSTAPTSSVFSVGTDATVNASGGTYVAYLFAHDTSSTGIIQCGSYVGTGVAGLSVNLGWEPQLLLVKKSSSTSDWFMFDVMRGMPNGATDYILFPNDSSGESNYNYLCPTATGFTIESTFGLNDSGSTYIYMAIRRPNKPPTTGTQVFGLNARTGTGANATVTGGQTDDAVLVKNRGSAVGDLFASRLTGINYIETSSTAAEVVPANLTILQANPWDVMDGVKVGTTSTITNASTNTFINYFFKRALGFFDEVCYKGTSTNTTQAHNLTVVPELMIVKRRDNIDDWGVYNVTVGNTKYLKLNTSAVPNTDSTAWNNTSPTISVFSVGTHAMVNASGGTYVAYLFATLVGISKVGSYTGNGTGQAIACGFGSGGARFVLIKRTDSTGGWYTFDSARGLTSGSSPYLLLNSTAAEVTGNNGVYASSGGFTLGATAITTTNIATATYIYLSVA